MLYTQSIFKTEIFRLYKGACDQMNDTKETNRSSTRTLWNIVQNCPAGQQKKLSGLESIAGKWNDSFECLSSRLKFM